MPRPAILAIDDEPVVRQSIERDLRARYGRDYRIVTAESGDQGLEVLRQLAARGEPVSLLVVDQRMPRMSGIDFLAASRPLAEDAGKVLLTAYADTEAAIRAINEIGLSHYLMKPWHPPEERLYPVLDDLLDEWRRQAQPAFEGIRLVGALWSPASHIAKDFLARHQIPYLWLDIDRDEQAKALAIATESGAPVVPTLLFPDGTTLAAPSPGELAAKLGLQTAAAREYYDVAIIGGGPAGLAAAVYGSSEGMRVVLIERAAPGGQAGRSPKIENYLGFPAGISGGDLAQRAVAQARRFGTEILSAQEAVAVERRDPYRIVRLQDGGELTCGAVLLASGATFRILKMPGASELTGRGVYYGSAHTEAGYFAGRDVFVIGGANSAAQAAMYLALFANKVTVLVRADQPTAAGYLVEAMRRNERIAILTNTDLIEVHGNEGLESVRVKNNRTGEEQTLPGAALFVFIGVRPESGLVAEQVARDEKGYILTGPDLTREGKLPPGWTLSRHPYAFESSLPGVFAAGDVRFGTSHRVSSATGEGAAAVAIIRQYLQTL
ncbi:MAG TPA: FAD-dependent oxidoreductase [Anaerolineales bacterium]|nr:FAD-dependent oxidoreductase [Anaerolineales bacterium]